MRKKSSAVIHGLLDCDVLHVVLRENQSTNSSVILYSLKGDRLEKEKIDTVYNNNRYPGIVNLKHTFFLVHE